MATAAAQRMRQRLFGKGLEITRFVVRQNQLDGKTERWIDRQQLAVTAEVQRREPGRLPRACLAMVAVSGGLMLGMVMVLAELGGLSGLNRRVQRADMNHQHGEQAKPDTQCRKPFACHRHVLQLTVT